MQDLRPHFTPADSESLDVGPSTLCHCVEKTSSYDSHAPEVSEAMLAG